MNFPKIVLGGGRISDCDDGGVSSAEVSRPLGNFFRQVEKTFNTKLVISSLPMGNSSAEGRFQALIQELEELPNVRHKGLLVLADNRNLPALAKRFEAELLRRERQVPKFVFDHRSFLFVGSTKRFSQSESDAQFRIVDAIAKYQRMQLGVRIMTSDGDLVYCDYAGYEEETGRIITLPWTEH